MKINHRDDLNQLQEDDHGGALETSHQDPIETLTNEDESISEQADDEKRPFLSSIQVEAKPTPLSTVLGYAITTLGTQMLTHIFNTYYVETFLFIHKLPPSYFYIGQFLFAIFNAVNDPLFGYISDNLIRDKKRKITRQQIMFYGCPLLVISFLVPWIQFRNLVTSQSTGDAIALLQFIAALFLWDSSFTWVVLNHCALLPELTESEKEKGRISTAVSICR